MARTIHRAPGADTPTWAGPVMLLVGTVAWGASALAADEPEPVTSKEAREEAPEVAEPAPAAVEPPTPQTPEPTVVESEVAQAAPAHVEEPEPCAPVVELSFAPRKTAADADNAERVRTIVETARQWPEHKLVIEGYADATGSDYVNLRLSHDRAAGVRDRLAQQGIDEERLVVQAFGEFRPDISGDADRDRRVVVRIAGIAQCEAQEGKIEDADR